MHLEKLVLVLSAVIACVLSSKLLDQEWKEWKAKHEKEYSHFRDEMFRRKAWEATWHKVQKHNQLADQGLSRYRMAMNKFADMQFDCLYKPNNAVTFNVTKYYILPEEDNMAMSLAFNGPIAVGIDASDDFQMYSDGIFDGECSSQPNHAVIIVGYGTEHDDKSNEDIDYWIIKNSWGEDWGKKGYVKIRRNVNKCGIATDASSVDLAR